MVSVPNAIPDKPSRGPDRDLTFLIEPEPWLRVFARNIADLFRPAPPRPWLSSRPAEYWPDALVHRPVAWAAMRQSFLGHALAVLSIYGATLLWMNRPQVLPQNVPRTSISNYQLSDYLPAVKPAHKKAAPVRREPQEADPEYAPQEIVSINVDHNSIRQTVVNPVSPKLLTQDIPLPNIVVWTPVPSPAPVANNHQIIFPLAAPQVVPPTQETAKRNLNNLQLPVPAPEAVAPAQQPVTRDLAALNMPVQPQAAVPPSPSAVQRNLGDINLALNTPAVEAPQLPMPEQQATDGKQAAQGGQPASSVPAAQPVTSGTGRAQGQEMGQLLALNARPIVPNGSVTVPEGNRQGEFAAGPNGRIGASARPEIKAGQGDSLPAGNGGTSNVPANIYVGDPPKKVAGSAVVSGAPPVPNSASPIRPDHAVTTSPDVPTSGRNLPGRIEEQVFGGKRYYSMSLNMPNLASAAGSWIIRFAEMNPAPGTAGENLSAPVAVYKVDPAYPATLARDRVEGVVVLYAVIHSDGSVGQIKVLQGVQDSLDENACTALQKWHFRPATKNGAPVELEAVIQVPFKAPRIGF